MDVSGFAVLAAMAATPKLDLGRVLQGVRATGVLDLIAHDAILMWMRQRNGARHVGHGGGGTDPSLDDRAAAVINAAVSESAEHVASVALFDAQGQFIVRLGDRYEHLTLGRRSASWTAATHPEIRGPFLDHAKDRVLAEITQSIHDPANLAPLGTIAVQTDLRAHL